MALPPSATDSARRRVAASYPPLRLRSGQAFAKSARTRHPGDLPRPLADVTPAIALHEFVAYDGMPETTSDTAHSPPVWTTKASQCGTGIGDGGKCAAAQRRSGHDSLDWSAHVFVGTDCSRRVVRPSRCRTRVLDCQGGHHKIEGDTTSVTQNRASECRGDVSTVRQLSRPSWNQSGLTIPLSSHPWKVLAMNRDRSVPILSRSIVAAIWMSV